MTRQDNTNGSRRTSSRRKRKIKHHQWSKPRKVSLNAVAGIDIDSTAFDCCVVFPSESSDGGFYLARRDRNLSQDEHGFQQCEKFLRDHGVKKVVLEATGVYHVALQYYLLESGFEVATVNPFFVNPKGKNLPKRDKLDAFKLAEKLFYGSIHEEGQYKPSYIPRNKIERALKHLTRLDKRTKDDRTRTINRVHKTLARHAIRINTVTGSSTKAWGLILEALTLAENESMFMTRINQSKTIHALTQQTFEKKKPELTTLLDLGRRKLDSADRILLRSHLKQIRGYNQLLDELQVDIERKTTLLPPSTQRLREICREVTKGISNNLAMRIVIEFGNPHRFRNRRKVGSYAGLEPVIRMSGGKGSIRHISKTGNKYLRRHLFVAANIARQFEEKYSTVYGVLRKKNRPHKVAVCAIARKIGVAYILRAKEDEIYNELLSKESKRPPAPEAPSTETP